MAATRENHLFCFGLGYSAVVLADRLRARGWQISGTTRDAAKARALSAHGIAAVMFERGRPLDPAVLATASHILSAVPPDEAGDPVLDVHGGDLTRLRPAWAGYLSTTGVYGDRGGDWVDEDATLRPIGVRGRRRVAAEAGWRALGLPLHIFRLAGIYGPGRSALDTVRAGRAQRIDKPGQVFSRIHVDDLAAVIEASIARPNPGAIYNVCDDDPAPPQDVIAHACRLLGIAAPPLVPFDTAVLSPMARSFYDENKRVSNRRIKTELGVRLRYPDYRAGLAALAESR
ncbi:MAG TPA: SDR family oxidoreductase [Candidatus Sulfotelmatobacter sp.]|nr:SDR family oxidoreductase [Candidatus Sulfotelmatobacter sp.]